MICHILKKFFINITTIHLVPMNSLTVKEKIIICWREELLPMLLQKTDPLQFLSVELELILSQFKSFPKIKLLKNKLAYERVNFSFLK